MNTTSDSLQRELAELIPNEADFEIEQIDPRGRNGALLVHVRTARQAAWWRRDTNGWHVCAPEDDHELPLAELLRELSNTRGLKVLNYRPGKRLVVRQDQENGARVIKGYRTKRFALARARHEWAALVFADGPLRAPTVRATLEPHAGLVFEAHTGTRPSLASTASDIFFRVGVGLRRMQARPLPEAFGVHDANAELALLDKLYASVSALSGRSIDIWENTRSRLVSPTECGATLATHRDLHDGQLLVGESLVLLDFDLLCAADRFLDAGNLIAHLRLRQLQGLFDADSETVDSCGRALLEGLDRDAERGAQRRLRFYQATSFLRLALVYRLRKRWEHLTPELVNEASRCLDES